MQNSTTTMNIKIWARIFSVLFEKFFALMQTWEVRWLGSINELYQIEIDFWQSIWLENKVRKKKIGNTAFYLLRLDESLFLR